MATAQSGSVDSDSTGGRLRLLLTEYRAAAYGILSILAVWISGYVVDIAAGPLTDETQLAHTVSGLLGATAMVMALCGLFITILWVSLVLSNRRGN